MDGNLPIHLIIGYSELIEIDEYAFLIDSYPDCLKVKNNKGRLPLHQAFLAFKYDVGEWICNKYPDAAKAMLDIAIEKKSYDMIHWLARACPNAFDIRCTCDSHLPCDCHSAHPIMRVLDESKVAKWRSQLVSVLLRNSENQKKKTAAIFNQTAELESKLGAMRIAKNHAQIFCRRKKSVLQLSLRRRKRTKINVVNKRSGTKRHLDKSSNRLPL
jgi:hypothetical protein